MFRTRVIVVVVVSVWCYIKESSGNRVKLEGVCYAKESSAETELKKRLDDLEEHMSEHEERQWQLEQQNEEQQKQLYNVSGRMSEYEEKQWQLKQQNEEVSERMSEYEERQWQLEQQNEEQQKQLYNMSERMSQNEDKQWQLEQQNEEQQKQLYNVSGRVNKPKVSFSANRLDKIEAAKQRDFKPMSVIIYYYTIHDEGENYDNTTGHFTCPVSGIYMFSFSMHVISEGLIQLKKGDTYVADATVPGALKPKSGVASNVAVVHCFAGESVHVFSQFGVSAVDYSAPNTFSGFLVYTTEE